MRFIILFLISLTILSCGKENQDPVFNDYSLIGTWISKDATMTLNISNTSNIGDTEKYYEYQEGAARLLRRTYNNIPTTYQILLIGEIDLKLKERNGNGYYEFLRVK